MSRENLLNSFSETSKNFFNEFIKDFKPDISSEEFNKFKFQFINMLIEVKLSYNTIQELSEFFDNERLIQLVLNTMQIGLNIWNNTSNKEKLKNDIFIYFFLASCFLVIKVIFFIYISLVGKSKKNKKIKKLDM